MGLGNHGENSVTISLRLFGGFAIVAISALEVSHLLTNSVAIVDCIALHQLNFCVTPNNSEAIRQVGGPRHTGQKVSLLFPHLLPSVTRIHISHWFYNHS